MGVFSEMDIDRRAAQYTDTDNADEMDLRAKAEEIDDARQEAEAEAAQAALAKLTKDDEPVEGAPADEAPPEDNEEQKRKEHEEAEAKRKAEWEAKKKSQRGSRTVCVGECARYG